MERCKKQGFFTENLIKFTVNELKEFSGKKDEKSPIVKAIEHQ